MEEDRFSNPNPNPSSQTKLPPPSILLDRFQAMVRERDEEIRSLNASPNQSPPPLDATVVVRFYELLLRELTINSKPIITDLTILAGNHRSFADGIADAICTRISEVAPDQKLPSLYLLDSIVKNIGGEYIRPFTARLPEVFIGAYNQVHSSHYPAMRHLFKTWSPVFTPGVLGKIEDALQFNMSTSSGVAQRQQVVGPVTQASADSPIASPRPSRIHVNPKYLEAPHQLKSSVVTPSVGPTNCKKMSNYETEGLHQLTPEIPRRWSTMSPNHNYAGDYDRAEVRPPRVNSTVNSQFTTFNQDVPLPFPSRRSGILPPPKPPSPTRIGVRRSRSPPADLYTDGPSTSHIFRNGYRVHNPNPRELIDAYGNDNRKIQRLGNGREWKRSEEEEFVWEDMSPTFSDQVRRDQREKMGLYGTSSALVGGQVELDQPDSRPVEPSYRRSWPVQGHLGSIEDRSYVLEERKPTTIFGDNTSYKKYQNSVVSHGSSLPYHHPSSNHVQEPPRLPPYATPTLMQANHGGPHLGRPSHNPANVTQVKPPPIYAPRRSQIGQHESIPAPANSMRLPPPKPDFIRSVADSSLDVNKPSLFVPSVSVSPVPVPVIGARHALIQQPMLIMHTRGVAATSVAVNPAPSSAAQPRLLQSKLPVGVVGAPSHGSTSVMPPLPPGRPPSSSAQVEPASLSTGPTQSGSAPVPFSGLLNTLMAQGLISLNTQQAPLQDTLGFNFNPDILRIRNESSINALYSDLSRQCTSCGVRFQHQEEHSAHMDWHVTKNRVARNRKQKPSRKWFVSAKEWLRGAETIGSEALPVAPAVETEKEDDVEVAVPADEDQTVCALCGEPFEDFYSDETEEWMYKGAVYMNGTDGSGVGPIVHAKCRSESTNT
ncbi:Pre-mRNA cleavage complex 2 protein Pcf11 [Rhynchospora pubera]|uniref:Pre-mRNA cleavage complex 2 protein Pcf11 n=1 Tax=Rhynchospora pubera TaxID=906938 RepID=A0AAV8GVB1_9POAL|nr:Pre-mRNA cleavage complex 2 protein Pcf11 [Rhynchospora pubera]